MRGLFTGPRGATPQQGAVFVVGTGQQLVNFGPYKSQLEAWLGNSGLVDGSVSPYVAWWSQEAYASCSKECVGGAKVGDRSTHLNEYVEHPARLASRRAGAGGSRASTLRPRVLPADDGLLARREGLRKQPGLPGPDAGADEPRGRTPRVHWAIRNPYPDGRIGSAWNEHPAGATPAQVQALATRVAQSIAGAYGDGGTATKACSPTGTYALVQGHARRREVQSGLGDVR